MVQGSSYICSLVQSLRPASFPPKLANYRGYTSRAASHSLSHPSTYSDDEYADVDWDKLGFGLTPTDYMYVMRCSKDDNFKEGRLSRYANIEISPSAGVLNYGQAIFEGTKANRTEDGRILLFRPDQNATRMMHGAERMCMPSPSIQQFVDAVKETVLANKRWIPPPGKGSLYVRPLLVGTGPILGLAPAPEYTFLVYASPEGTAPLSLYIDEEFVRASPGGAGGVKTITNYAPVLKAIARAEDRGFSDVLYLDAVNRKYLEEAKLITKEPRWTIYRGNRISTPAISGTILQGITRKSILEIARDHDYQVEERAIPVDDLGDADEVFCTGTAVGVAPVGSITHRNRRIEFKTEGSLVCKELYSTLVGLQTGRIEDKKGWTVEIH